MYNPYGSIRSWVANALVSQVAARIDSNNITLMCLVMTEMYVNGTTFEDAVNVLGAVFDASIRSTVAIAIYNLASRIHSASVLDLSLEISRMVLKLK